MKKIIFALSFTLLCLNINVYGKEVSGNITGNTTWDAGNSPYTLVGNVNIAPNVTLTIDPGVEIAGKGFDIVVYGTLSAIGTSADIIHFTNTNIVPGNNNFTGPYYLIDIKYAEISGGSIYRATGNAVYGSINIRNSTLDNVSDFYLWYPEADCYFEYNVFMNCSGLSIGIMDDIKVYIHNNVFIGQTGEFAVQNWASYSTSETVVAYNTFMDTDKIALMLPNGYASARMNGRNNFWNTTDKNTIESMIWDQDDDFSIADTIPFHPFLTQADPATPVVARFTSDIQAWVYPVDIQFTDLSSGNITSWSWDFGDGQVSTDQYPLHTYTDEGVYSVKLAISDGTQVDTVLLTDFITVGKPPKAGFTSDKTETCPATYITYTDTSLGDITNVFWEFEGGFPATSTSTAEPVFYESPGDYTVKLIAYNTYTSDTILSEITVNPNPVITASIDASICSGDSTNLKASGGISYTWTGSYSGDSIWVKPMTTQDYIVTGTDLNGCSNYDTVNVLVIPTPTSAFSLPSIVCGENEGTITYAGSATNLASYDWNFDGGSIASGTGQGPYQVSWPDAGTKTLSLSVSENGCESALTQQTLEVNPIRSSEFEIQPAVCGSDQVTIEYTGDGAETANYDWTLDGGNLISGSGQGPLNINWDTDGNKTVSLQVTENGCSSIITDHIIYVAYPYEDEEICLVTIDEETGKNMVVWENTPGVGIDSYNIYRETNVSGVYTQIGSVPAAGLSLFIDMVAIPEQQQYLYKISAVDTCGNESDLSQYHKTLFLQYTPSDMGVNLSWKLYQIEETPISFVSYILSKGTDSTELEPFDTISGGLDAYTDNDPHALETRYYYRIAGVKAQDCDASGGTKAGAGPYSHSISNLENNRLQASGIRASAAFGNIKIFPNPFSESTVIRFSNSENSSYRLKIFDLSGKVVKSAEVNEPEFILHRDNLENGYYIIELQGDSVYRTKLIIE